MDTVMCLNFGTPEIITCPFWDSGKFIILGFPILKYITVNKGIILYIINHCFRQYIENIRYIDKGMKEMEELVDGFYGNDGKTAYVMSSDHGMTDWG